jgi:flavorubredoxin
MANSTEDPLQGGVRMVFEIKKGVYWVGVVDWGLRHFHGHELTTHRGSSYNAYLIIDKKVTLVDTVWTPFTEELLANIREIIDPSKIDIIVVNHAEIDHSGALPEILRHAPQAEIICSKRGTQSLEGHFHQPWKFRTVKTGDRVSLGASELVFIEAPMLHWPDSMFTYLSGQNILMPNDAFGQHYAAAFRFNDEVNQEELYEEALKYYVNILTPFSSLVTKKIAELSAMNLPIDIIAPSHGIIWRKDPLQIVQKYKDWAKQTPECSATILFDTMWNGTRRMAEAIGEGLSEDGIGFKILDMAVTDRNDALVEVFRTRTIIMGSPTLNQGVLPTIMPILTDMRGLKFKNKLGAAFGCFGWSGESVKIIQEYFSQCGIPLLREGINCKWQPSDDELKACRTFGREIGEITKKSFFVK